MSCFNSDLKQVKKVPNGLSNQNKCPEMLLNQSQVLCSSAIIKNYFLRTSRTEAEGTKDAFQLQDTNQTNKGLEEKDGDEPSGNTIITISDSSELEVGGA
jgi:hypothetical protein